MEYCQGGELCELVTKYGCISDPQLLNYTKQILQALNYLHSRGIAHRDLKLENIMLGEDNVVKIIDFGISTTTDSLHNTICGTPVYMAPEIVIGKEYDPCKADIWSLGVIVYAMATNSFPFASKCYNKNITKIASGEVTFPKLLSEKMNNFVSKMLDPSPANRLKPYQLLENPVFLNPIAHIKVQSQYTIRPVFKMPYKQVRARETIVIRPVIGTNAQRPKSFSAAPSISVI